MHVFGRGGRSARSEQWGGRTGGQGGGVGERRGGRRGCAVCVGAVSGGGGGGAAGRPRIVAEGDVLRVFYNYTTKIFLPLNRK